MLDHTLKSDVTSRRLEVITETGRRRWFSKDDKARIVEETLVAGAVVSEIARRHGLLPQTDSVFIGDAYATDRQNAGNGMTGLVDGNISLRTFTEIHLLSSMTQKVVSEDKYHLDTRELTVQTLPAILRGRELCSIEEFFLRLAALR